MDHSFLQMIKHPKISFKGLSYIIGACLLLLIGLFIFYFIQINYGLRKSEIAVGILFSQSGSMADTERPVLRATLLAIDEINQKGGINGSRLVPIVYDPASNWNQYAVLADRMITQDKVSVIFGCFTSAARKEVKNVVEKYDNLLFYPVSYEGAEESPNIVYLGMSPNQQLTPAVSWIIQKPQKKVYLVGSDYIWPRVANEIMTYQIRSMGSEVIGLHYISMGSLAVNDIVDDIIAKKPDFVFSTTVGTTNIALLNRMYEKIPRPMPTIMSFGIIPYELNKQKSDKFTGLYSVWSYNPGLNNPENMAFLDAYQKKYGSTSEVNDPAATSYSGVYLWADTVQTSPNSNPEKVRDLILRRSIASPIGVLYVDANATAWRTVFIERLNKQGNSDIVWSSEAPIEPIIYPDFKTKGEWGLFEYKLYVGWGNAWERK